MLNLADFTHEASFVTQAISGDTNFETLFTGLAFKVDDDVRRWLSGNFRNFKADELVCDVYDPLGTYRLDSTIIGATGLELIRPNRNHLWAILSFLSLHLNDDTPSFFDIPEEEEEVKFILGYMCIDGSLKVLELEHQHEAEMEEEIHLHAEEMNRDRRVAPKLLVAKKLE